MSWSEDLWALIAQSAFTGKAQIAYSSLSDEDSGNYTKVKEAVLAAYQLVPEAYRQKFRSWKKRPFQTFIEFAKQKEIKLDEWLHSEGAKDFGSLRELLLLENFKNSIPREVRTHIEEFNIDNLEDAAKAADRFVLSHKTNFSKNNSVKEAGVGRGSGSLSPKKSAGQGRDIVCYGCGEIGHIKSKCPKPQKATKPAMLVDCCKVSSAVTEGTDIVKNEDSIKDCFKGYISMGVVKSNPSMEGGLKVTVLRDSGSCQSCILESSLPRNFVREGSEYVLLGGFPNTVSSWPLERVFLETSYFTGWCKLAVVKSFPLSGIDVLLGNDL